MAHPGTGATWCDQPGMPAPNLSVIRLEPVTALPYWFHTDLPGVSQEGRTGTETVSPFWWQGQSWADIGSLAQTAPSCQHDDIKCNKELEEFIGSGMAKFWETPNGLKLMADGKRRLVQKAEKFCAPFSKSDTSGAPLPPYACVTPLLFTRCRLQSDVRSPVRGGMARHQGLVAQRHRHRER